MNLLNKMEQTRAPWENIWASLQRTGLGFLDRHRHALKAFFLVLPLGHIKSPSATSANIPRFCRKEGGRRGESGPRPDLCPQAGVGCPGGTVAHTGRVSFLSWESTGGSEGGGCVHRSCTAGLCCCLLFVSMTSWMSHLDHSGP